MILYKYCPPERVDVLASGLIGLTRPRSFNDPFEFSPDLSAVDSGIEMSRRTWEHTKSYVVLCFAEEADNALMWGHYAAGLNGFVIGFESDRGILADSSQTRRLNKVTYLSDRPSKPTLEHFSDEEIFFTKSSVWAYEKEWRIVDSIDSAARRVPPPNGYDTWLFRFNPDAVTEVICGYRGQSTADGIQNILRLNRYQHVTFKIAHPDQRIYRLRTDVYERAEWEYWYLDRLPNAPASDRHEQ